MSGWLLLLGGTTLLCSAVALVAIRAVVLAAQAAASDLLEAAGDELPANESSALLLRTEELAERGRLPTVPPEPRR